MEESSNPILLSSINLEDQEKLIENIKSKDECIDGQGLSYKPKSFISNGMETKEENFHSDIHEDGSTAQVNKVSTLTNFAQSKENTNSFYKLDQGSVFFENILDEIVGNIFHSKRKSIEHCEKDCNQADKNEYFYGIEPNLICSKSGSIAANGENTKCTEIVHQSQNLFSNSCKKNKVMAFSLLQDICLTRDGFENPFGSAENNERKLWLSDNEQQSDMTMQAKKQTSDVNIKNRFNEKPFPAQFESEINKVHASVSNGHVDSNSRACDFSITKITDNFKVSDKCTHTILHGLQILPLEKMSPTDCPDIMPCNNHNLVTKIDSGTLGTDLPFSANNITIKFQLDKLNLISSVDSSTSITDFFNINECVNPQSWKNINSIQMDQTVASSENNVLQKELEKINEDPIKKISEGISQHHLTPSDKIIKYRTAILSNESSNPISKLDTDKLTLNFAEKQPLESFPLFVVKRTKTVLEESLEFYNRSNIAYALKIDQFRCANNLVEVGSANIKTSDKSLTISSGPISNHVGLLEPEPNNSISCKGRADDKPISSDYKNLFEISNSSWADNDLIEEDNNVFDRALDKVEIEENVTNNDLQLLNGSGSVNCDFASSVSYIDELDSVIEDSIKKYENFTVDASVLATPTTADKSCQTEHFETQQTAICKRCLELFEESPEPMKKAKLSWKNEQFPPTLKKVDDSNNSSAFEEIHKSSKLGFSSSQNMEVNHSTPPINDENQFESASVEGHLEFNPTLDEIDKTSEEGSSFYAADFSDHDELMSCSYKSSFDSEQEVPICQPANQRPQPPSSFAIPKKPVLRVGLSRSARFKPLHPRM